MNSPIVKLAAALYVLFLVVAFVVKNERAAYLAHDPNARPCARDDSPSINPACAPSPIHK